MADQDRPYDDKILSAIGRSMSGWLGLEAFSYSTRTNVAKIRPHVERLQSEGVLISRENRGVREWTRKEKAV